MDVCTIISSRNIAHARLLAESLGETPLTALAVGPVDDSLADVMRVITPAEAEIAEFDTLAGIYAGPDLSRALRPAILRHMLASGSGTALYLDPETLVMDDLAGLDEIVADHDLVLTPFLAAAPQNGDGSVLPPGTYVPGFIGVSHSASSEAVLEWWLSRLMGACPTERESPAQMHQRLLDMAPEVATRFHSLRRPAFNLNPWNAAAAGGSNGTIELAGERVRVAHFEDFDPTRPHLLSSRARSPARLSKQPQLARLCADYAERLIERGYGEKSGRREPFSETAGGLALDPLVRRLYCEAHQAGAVPASVFEHEGEQQFFAWLNGPAPVGTHAGLTRLHYALYLEKVDLQRAYPDLSGADAQGFAGWLGEHGLELLRLPDALLPPPPRGRRRLEPNRLAKRPAWGVNVIGYFRSELGVGEAARRTIDALDACEVPLLPVHGRVVPPSRQGHGFSTVGLDAARFPVNLICVNADGLPGLVAEGGEQFFDSRYSVGMWWWEVDRFPEKWKSSFEHVDEVWVGSDHVARAVALETSVPVATVRLPVWVPDVAPLGRGELGLPEGFLFFHMFDYHSVFERKNPLAVVEAFKAAFEPGGGAALAVKCINAEDDPDGHERLLLAAAGHPDVHVVEGYVTSAEKNAMIDSCDCYVSLHRSEGFGLTMAEAMYLGRPAIATGYSGNLDFMTSENSYLVDYGMRSIGEGHEPYPAEGSWAEPSVEHAAELMRRVFEDPDEARERGLRAAREIRETHSRERAGEVMKGHLERIRARTAGGAALPGGSTEREADDSKPGIDQLRFLVSEGAPPEPSRSPAKRALRALLLRGLGPQLTYDRQIRENVAATIDEIDERVREHEERLRSVQDAAAVAQADLLAQLRRQETLIAELRNGRDQTP